MATEVVWRRADGGTDSLEAQIGKALDTVALKRTSLVEHREYAAGLAAAARALYDGARRELDRCPLCAADVTAALVELEVYGVAYHRCPSCAHAFVRSQPDPGALDDRFSESDELASTYTDLESLEVRLEQVVRPKVQWTLDVYRRHCGGEPRCAVDVGAGGGHFVSELRRAGVAAEGFELSRASRRFAHEQFGVELRDEDFLAVAEPADLVTFWGLLEYTPEPRRFLAAARRALAGGGLLVVEVPRFDCLGTAVQKAMPELVARHLDPTSHVNCFSDSGLATALHAEGFRPVAAWYFGMDAYELAVQLALRLGDEHFPVLAELLLPLQAAADAALWCDDVVVAASPER